METLENLMKQAMENGVKLVACTMSMDVMGIRKEEIIDGVEFAGVASYLGDAENSDVNLLSEQQNAAKRHLSVCCILFQLISCFKPFLSRIVTPPLDSFTSPSDEKYFSIRLTTSLALPVYLAICSWVIWMSSKPVFPLSSRRKIASL